MFPLYDSTPHRRFPFINYLIILINSIVFIVEISSPDFEQSILPYTFIPSQFSLFNPVSYIPIITAMFMHGSILHIISNLWFLRIFGDNVEDVLGHFKYLIFYLAGGIVAALAQYFIDPTSTIPTLGASGAISAVAGFYFVFFRNSTVKTFVPIFFFFTLIDLSAPLFLGYWFVIQVFSGLGSLGGAAGGVAWFAHIGGFVFGYIIARMMHKNYAEEGEIVS